MENNYNILNKGNNKKRKLIDITRDDEAEPNKERVKKKYYFTIDKKVISTIDQKLASASAIDSETDRATDTSDTNTNNTTTDSNTNDQNSETEEIIIEFNVGDDVGDDDDDDDDDDEDSKEVTNLLNSSSSSGPQDISAIDAISCSNKSGLSADVSEHENSDCEKKYIRFRCCLNCEGELKDVDYLFKYCQKCYQKRRLYFPRPRPRRKTTASSKPEKNSKIHEMDSGLGSRRFDLMSLSSQEMGSSRSVNENDNSTSTLNLPSIIKSCESVISLSEKNLAQDSKANMVITTKTSASGSQEKEVNRQTISKDEYFPSQQNCIPETSKNSMMREVLSRLEARVKNGDTLPPMLCIVCYENKRNGAFNHGLSCHQICCYKCAKKVCKNNGNRCPVCNRAVSQVLKLFFD